MIVRVIFCCLFGIGLNFSGLAQGPDSLRHCMNHAEKAEETYTCMIKLARYYVHQPNYDSTLILTKTIKENFAAYKDSNIYIRAIKTEGLANQYKGNYQEAISIFREVGEFHRRKASPLYYENRMDIGLVYIRMEAWEQALPYLRECYAHRDEINTYALGNTFNCLGIVMQQLKEPDSAIYYFKQSIQAQQEAGYTQGVINAYINLGGTFAEYLQEFDSAHVYFRKGQELCKQTNSQLELMGLLINEGATWEYEGKYRQAARNYEEALALADSTGSLVYIKYALFNAADVYGNQLNEPAKAYPFLERYSKLVDSIYQKEKSSCFITYSSKTLF